MCSQIKNRIFFAKHYTQIYKISSKIIQRIQAILLENRDTIENLVGFKQNGAPPHFFSPVMDWLFIFRQIELLEEVPLFHQT